MRWVNLNDVSMSFSVAGKAYVLAPMDECEIPDSLAWVVKGMGLMLTPASAVEPVKPQPEEPKPIAKKR